MKKRMYTKYICTYKYLINVIISVIIEFSLEFFKKALLNVIIIQRKITLYVSIKKFYQNTKVCK
jgi:hypothetical protein